MSSDVPAPELRVSYEDRDRVAETLRVAAGEGRLTPEELDTRLEAALSAKTFGDLAALTSDLPSKAPSTPTAAPKDVLVIEQYGGRLVRDGRWVVPHRIDLTTSLSKVTLDFTEAVITSDILRIETKMVHGRLRIVTAPGIVVDNDGLKLIFSKINLRGDRTAEHPRLRIELSGSLTHAKVIERRRRR